MERIEGICKQRERAHERLLSLDSKVYKAFLDMEKAAYSDGALPKKTKELIAIGISVVMDCQSCMQWHIDQAARAGASQQEILEAVGVGIEMGAGRVTVSARFALEVMEAVYNGSEPRTQNSEHGSQKTGVTRQESE
ncbi:MAG: carboxymuconolactone decarboxylase family protein [Phycisphaerae bacterium]|nr:carboxymuconolactone decarboxylase family protein [Phycisphaerae bacterium]